MNRHESIDLDMPLPSAAEALTFAQVGDLPPGAQVLESQSPVVLEGHGRAFLTGQPGAYGLLRGEGTVPAGTRLTGRIVTVRGAT